MTACDAVAASAPPLPQDPQERVRQAEEQIRHALAAHGATRLDMLRHALQLNPYALKARYLLGASLLQAGEIAPARQVLDAVAQVAPDYAPVKFYRFVATIRKPKKGDLAKADALLKELEQEVAPNLPLVLCWLELSLRRKKSPVPMTDWLGWLKQIPITRKNVPLVADKCAKFFLERKQADDGDQVLAWLKDIWCKKFPDAPLLSVLSYLHHISYWPPDRWVAELQQQVFDEVTGDLVCLFILERTKKDEKGKNVPEDKRLEELRTLVAQLPGVSSLAYNYLSLLNTAARKRLLTDGDVKGAVQLWRESSRLDPFNTLIQFNLALAEAEQGRTQKYYYRHWQQALRLAYWRWELGDDRQDWELCVARAYATANKLHEKIMSERDNRDTPPADILAWLKYLDVYAISRQLTFEHPRHLLGVHADAPAAEARRIAQGWQTTLDGWERRNNLKPPYKFGAHLPSELVTVARERIQKAIKSRRKSVSDSELDAFREYCEHRAEHTRDLFFMSAYLADRNRFDEAQALIDRLVAMPLATLELYIKEIKINTAEGEIPLSDLINEKELAQRKIGYVCAYAEFLAEEGDDQELARQIEEIDSLPWAQLDDPDEFRRKVRERIAFAVLDPAAFDAINDDRWADALPAIEAALKRLPDQLDLLWLATLALFRSVEDQFGKDPDQVRWRDVQVALKKASGYCQRAKKIAPNEVEARMGDLPEAVENAYKMATEMSSPRGKALRRARSLMNQEEWNQAYKVLSKVSSKDQNAEIEFYLGLCIYRETGVSSGPGKKRPSLSTLRSRLKKAASHLRSARRKAVGDDLKEGIKNLSEAVDGMLEQVEYALIRESAESLMGKEQWDKAYNKLSKISKPDAGLLFYMAICRFRRVMQEFEQASPYSQPSIPQAIKRLQKALDHIRDAKRICDDNLKGELNGLENAVCKNLNILKTM